MKHPLRAVVSILICTMTSGSLAQGNKPDLVWMRGGIVGAPTDLNYSSDGKLIVSCDGGTIKIWRVNDGMCLRTINSSAKFAQFNPAGDLLAGVAPEGVYFWHVPDGRQVGKIPSGGGNLRCFAFTPDWQFVATGSDDTMVRLHNASTGALISSFAGHTAAVDSVAFSANRALLVSGAGSNAQGNEQKWRTWNLASGLPDKVVSGPTVVGSGEANVSYKVSFSTDGLSVTLDIFCAYLDHCMYLASTGVLVNHYTIAPYGSQSFTNGANRYNWLNAVRVSPDGSLGAVTGRQAVIFFNYLDGNGVRTSLQGIEGPYFGGVGTSSLCFSPDGRTLAIGTPAFESDSPIQFWAAVDGSLLRYLTPPGPSSALHILAASPDGQTIASRTAPGQLLLRRASDGQPYFAAGYGADSVAFSPDSTLCATHAPEQLVGCGGTRLLVRRTADGSVLHNIATCDSLNKVQFSPDGKYFVVLAHSAQIIAYNVSDGTIAFTFPLSASRFWISPDGTYLATPEGGVKLYAWPSGALVKQADVPTSGNEPLAWSPDSSSLVVLSEQTRRLNVPDLTEIWRSDIPVAQLDTAHFSPDGQVIALTGQATAKLLLYSAADGTLLTAYNDETAYSVMSAAYSPDGKFIYYGRGDGTLCCALNPFRQAVLPRRGGNTGNVTVKIITPPDFPAVDGTTVTLNDSAHPDISISAARVSDFVLTGTFDLRGAPVGLRDVVISVPGGGTRTYPQGFTIEQGLPADVVVDIIGRSVIRGGVWSTFSLLGTNIGNIDSGATTLGVTFPRYLDWSAFPGFATSSVYHTDVNTFLNFSAGIVPAALESITPLRLAAPDKFEFGHRQFALIPFISGISVADLVEDNGYVVVKHEGQGLFGVKGGHVDPPAGGWGLDTQVKLRLRTGDNVTVLVNEQVAKLTADEPNAQLDLGGPPGTIDILVDKGLIEYLVETSNSSGKGITIVTTRDPNDLSGSLGYGPSQWVSSSTVLNNLVTFANEPEATAPVAFISVTDHLDPTVVDTTTVQIGAISFAGQTILPELDKALPVGKRTFSADVDLRPTKKLIVHVTASLDMLTGELTWTFITLDPATMMPPDDPLAGFLDPGQEGSAFFSVMPRAGVPTGTVVTNQASIVFDTNAPMDTNIWFNTIDNDLPLSLVNKLASQQSALSFPVSWKTADVGSGVRDISILVSDNGGPFTSWLTNTTDTSATYTGLNGHTYAFKSRARDNVYNLEAEHAAADTVTKIIAGPPKFFLQSAAAARANGLITVTGKLQNTGGDVAKSASIKLASAGKLAGVNTISAVPINLGDIPVNGTKDFTLTFPGSITAGSKVLQVQVSFTGGSSTASKAVAVP